MINHTTDRDNIVMLTAQETRILSMLIIGKTSKEICFSLNIAMTTYRAYLRNIRLKTRARTMFELGMQSRELVSRIVISG